MLLRFALSCGALACRAADGLDGEIATFVKAAQVRRDVAETFDAAAQAKSRRSTMHLRRSDMPDGPRAWITLRVDAPPDEVASALVKALGPVTGRGFGDEEGWLLPTGGIILERFDDRAHITFSPGPPEDALEDLARPHLPDAIPADAGLQPTFTNEGRRLVAVHGTEAAVARATGVTVASRDKCVATGNYFVVRQADGITVWRRPFAMWNVDVQRSVSCGLIIRLRV